MRCRHVVSRVNSL